MTISTLDQLLDAMGNNATLFVINKASIASQIAGGFSALWRATGTPAQGAVPTTAARCTNATTGCFGFTNPTSPARSYLARLFAVSANAGTDLQFHDRLAHMGGLSGTSTAAQTANVDTSGTSDNIDNRRGDSNYSDVQWWLEWYTATGATGVTATVTYTNAAGTTGRTTTVSVSASTAASRRLAIIGNGGEFIQSVQTVQLSATTGTAGNFGVTATRLVAGISLGIANYGSVSDWAMLGLPRVHDSACIEMIVVPTTTSSGALYGSAKLAQG